MMPKSSRNGPAEEDDGGDRGGRVRSVWLTVSEATTEIMCLRTKGVPESTTVFRLEAAGQVYDQTNESVHLGGDVTCNTDLSIEVDR